MSSKYIPKALRLAVAEQAKHRCGYCLTQEAVSGFEMEYDHLVPQALGGQTLEDNLWLACSYCNDAKNKRLVVLDPESGELVNLFNPRTQKWAEHFEWVEEGEKIIGLTPVGRATVVALSLNRPVVVIARKLWASWGKHPPTD